MSARAKVSHVRSPVAANGCPAAAAPTGTVVVVVGTVVDTPATVVTTSASPSLDSVISMPATATGRRGLELCPRRGA